MKPPVIQGILACISSRPDRAGHSAYAFRYTDTATGKSVTAQISGGEGNIRGIMYYLLGGSLEPRERYYYYEDEISIRKHERLVKDWPYAGCDPKELAMYIQRELGEHLLIINSLRDTDARCACGWTYMRPVLDRETNEEVRARIRTQYEMHLHDRDITITVHPK